MPGDLVDQESRNPTVLIWSTPTEIEINEHYGSPAPSQSHRTDLVNSDQDARGVQRGRCRRRNPTVLIWSTPTSFSKISAATRPSKKSQSHRTDLVNSDRAKVTSPGSSRK